MKYTALFGGTFNPPHMGHYEMLGILEKDPDIEEIWITPTKIPPHKVCSFLADDEFRIKMCEALSSDFSKAKVSLIEFERDGKSYTFDTVKLLKERYPEKNFIFAMGGDMLVTFDEWYKYEELLKMLPFIAFRRADIDNTEFDEKAELFTRMGMDLRVMDSEITDISSTELRDDFKALKGFLPEKVYNLIKDEEIYGA